MKDLKNTSGRKATKSKHTFEDARVVDSRKKEKKALWRNISAKSKKWAVRAAKYGIKYALFQAWENREEVLSYLLDIIS